jgi:uncharacterized phage-associated protein
MSAELNKYQIDKLGNALIYLSNNVGDFGKTKALKLLFLLEEKSVKEFGVPFFGFDFEVWQFGPVVSPIYNDLNSRDIPLLKQYIQRVEANTDEFEAIAEFNDDEFSNNDIFILNEVVKFSRNKTAADLVAITHGKDSLWLKAAEENSLLKGFEDRTITYSKVVIDFSSLLEDNSYLKDRYKSSIEYLQFNNQLKA